ncbi:ABC transporter permease [Litoribacter populi]|uniref:ABC transporter permease n=1 Tax=Litoribacter populi TaxID=2598460 RepID=UPI00117D91EA|nr:ABC transporter permease [Litoribacter populi]
MIYNYLKIIFRQLFKNKAYAFLNIGGLAIGIMAVMLIMIYFRFEFSFDRDLRHSSQLFRVNLHSQSEGQVIERSTRTSPGIGSVIEREVAGVEALSRVVILGEVIAGYEKDYIREENIFLVDPQYIDFFDLNIKTGNSALLEDPLKVMISEVVALKVFGDENPLGKLLDINSTNFDGSVEFEVVGVYESLPANRHLQPEILISYATLHHFIGKEIDESFDWLNLYSYLKISENTSHAYIEDQINNVLQNHYGKQLASSGTDWKLFLQPIGEIHTTPDLVGEFAKGVDGRKLQYFLWIAAFVLLMVYLNSINIANSKALNRSKEIGVRKASGGNKQQLLFQFMLESAIINLLAVCVAGIVIHAFGKLWVQLMGLGLPEDVFSLSVLFIPLLALWVLGTLASGLYPAMVLTSFSPAHALKGTLKFKINTTFSRPLLVVQLVFCLLILSGIFTVYLQLDHMRGQKLGLSIQDKLVVRTPMLFVEDSGNYQSEISHHFNELTGVKNVGVTNEIPGNEVYWRSSEFYREGGEKSGEMYTMLHVGKKYFDLFDIEIRSGRGFNTTLDEGEEAIINEKAREALGFSDNQAAIGEKLIFGGRGSSQGVPIVGVVSNYRQQGVNVEVNPMVLNYSPGDLNYYVVDVEKGQMATTLPSIKATFQQLFPNSPFEYYFLDEHFDKQYKSEILFVRLFGLAAMVAILIAVMGILGVTSQLLAQRSKEVSIRKILGASFEDVFYLISKEYISWLGVCFVIGIPSSYYLFSNWLDTFIIKITLGWWFYLLPAAVVILIFSLATVFQTVKTALVNPAEILKNE